MFTGIIEKLGTIEKISEDGTARRILVRTGFQDLALGESVAVNGVCLTVTDSTREGAAGFFVSSETLDKTSLGALRAGEFVNLERALLPTTRLSGHWVQGHVDQVGRLKKVDRVDSAQGVSYVMDFEISAGLLRYLVVKGSITVDGISLTVNWVSDPGTGGAPGPIGSFSVQIIPHTWDQTRLKSLRVGDPVNLEVDILAKYVERMLKFGSSQSLVKSIEGAQ